MTASSLTSRLRSISLRCLRRKKMMLGKILRTFLLIVLCCVCAAAQTSASNCAATSVNTDDSSTGNIRGGVVNESGQPFAGAQVMVRRINYAGGSRTAIADSEGTFRVNGLNSGLYVITASAPGYVPAQADPRLPVTHYRIGDSVRLELIRGGV